MTFSPAALLCRILILAGLLAAAAAAGEPPSTQNAALEGWQPLWTREPHAGQASFDPAVLHEGKPTVRIAYTGKADWCLGAPRHLAVHEGDLLEISAWVRVIGAGRAGVSVVAYDDRGKVVEWTLGQRTAEASPDGVQLTARLAVPAGVVEVWPRLTGDGAATVWVEGFTFRKTGNLAEMRGKDLPPTLTLQNQYLSVTLKTSDASFAVEDRRTHRTWEQRAMASQLVLTHASAIRPGVGERNGAELKLELLDVPTGQTRSAQVQLERDRAELVVTLAGEGRLATPLSYPFPFVTGPGTHLIVPLNEGISYPVDDPSIEPHWLAAYSGHGICMPFWGVTDGRTGHMAILETPDDAAIRIARPAGTEGGKASGNLYIAPQWEPQKGRLGYERRLRYVFFDSGGYVAMCQRYRAYAAQAGLLKTLAEKRAANPSVDLLIGAVNVWCWEKDPLPIVRQMQEAGIGRILWSNAASPESLRAMNELGVLTSRYDIYQDVMDPVQFPHLQWTHPDWPTSAWPKDLNLKPNADWLRGWEVEGKDGKMHPCGVLCDRQALPYARERIANELKTHPYRCRFIDTTTAAPWRECYAPDHPMTRSDSREWKMKLLGLVSREFNLVTGSETGHDAAVPFVHYFEGMLSLGPYRVPDAGRHMQKIWDEVPEPVLKFQVGHRYRLPLWELVYHDCVVAQWYWGDYNNKFPALWDRRDLFNALYGTPAMFMFDRKGWEQHRDRFVQSYKSACAVARATGYAQMTDHRFLTPDRDVQETDFANGVRVIANFGDTPYRTEAGKQVPAHGFWWSGEPHER